jgi:hypothetical protein
MSANANVKITEWNGWHFAECLACDEEAEDMDVHQARNFAADHADCEREESAV